MRITQESTYNFMKSLPTNITPEQYHEFAHRRLQVKILEFEGRVSISFTQEGDIALPLTAQQLYSPNGVRKPLQVGSMFLWQVVNDGVERFYQQNTQTHTLNLNGYSLLLSYVVAAEDVEVNGVSDVSTKGYVLVNNTDNVLNVTETRGVLQAWIGKQPIYVNTPQMQYTLKQIIQQQDRSGSVLDDILALERELYGL